MRRPAEMFPTALWRSHEAPTHAPLWQPAQTSAMTSDVGMAPDLSGLASLLLAVVLTLLAAPVLEQNFKAVEQATAAHHAAAAEATPVMALVAPPSGPTHAGGDVLVSVAPDAPAVAAIAAPPPVTVPTPPALAAETLGLDTLGDAVEVQVKEGAVVFRIRAATLFASGQPRLTPAGAAALAPLVAVLKRNHSRIAIEGHSDTVPIHTAQFPSNWELSASRAASVLRHLQTQGIAPERLCATGYAATQPLASNKTAAGRAANRRVELVMELAAAATT